MAVLLNKLNYILEGLSLGYTGSGGSPSLVLFDVLVFIVVAVGGRGLVRGLL